MAASTMRILLLGSGGREHALAWKIAQSPRVSALHCVPGNPGIAAHAHLERGNILNPPEMADLAERLRADLTMVGPEAPLVAGVVDEFQARGQPAGWRHGLRIVGPSRAAARLEGSKIFAKQFMARHGIPTAEFAVCESVPEARIHLQKLGFPVVIKADGLAAGKGVVVASDVRETEATLHAMLDGKLVGDAGRRVVLERFLPGEEVTFTVLADGRNALALPPTQDHKRVFDGDRGPNTGGMGAYSDDAILPGELRQRVMREIVQPTLAGMEAEGAPFRGVLYVGLMLMPEGPRVLEYNVRFGDPETQPLMMRLASDLVPLLEATTDGTLGSARAEWTAGATACVVAASAGYPGDFERDKAIEGVSDADRLDAVKVFHAGTRRRDSGLVTAGGRVLGVTAAGADLPEALARAYEGIRRVRFEGMHYRTDIGKKGLSRKAHE